MLRPGNLFLNVVTCVLASAAVLMVGLRVSQHFRPGESTAPQYRRITGWRKFAESRTRIGRANAAVTIVEFIDFQCPYCRRAAADLAHIRKVLPSEVAIIVRQFPLQGHVFAADAAQADECASRQGVLEAYSSALFDSPSSLGKKGWAEFAEQSGVSDIGAFKACLADQEIAQLVKADVSAGRELGVTGTPTFLINDLEVTGYPGEGQLEELVQAAMKKGVH